MKFFTILSLIFMIASAAIGRSEAGYGRINDYLIKKVSDDEIDSNMKAALEWLNGQSSGAISSLMIPTGDLKNFVALQQVIDDTKCDHTTYEIMRTNENAVGLHKLIYEGEAVRRIDKVMLKIFKIHAEKCLRVYPVTYKAKEEQLDKVVSKHVKHLAKTVMDSQRFEPGRRTTFYKFTPKNMFNRYVKYILTVKSFASHDILLNALVRNSSKDPNAKYAQKVPDESSGKQVVHKDKIRELTRKYLIEPCNQFEALMGPDLFIPARFDAQVYTKIDNNNEDYYMSWSQFVICKALTSNEAAVFREIIKSATDRY